MGGMAMTEVFGWAGFGGLILSGLITMFGVG